MLYIQFDKFDEIDADDDDDDGLHCECNVIAKHVRLTWLYLESILVFLLPKDSPVPKADIL